MAEEEGKTNLVVYYLPKTWGDEELNQEFSKYGNVKSCKVITNKYESEEHSVSMEFSKGMGFVDFYDPKDAEKAIKELHGKKIDELDGQQLESKIHKTLRVEYAQAKGTNTPDTKIYVANLGDSITEERVREMFESFGRILRCDVVKDRTTGKPRGIAFVTFVTRSEAKVAIEKMNGQLSPAHGQYRQLKVKFARNKAKEMDQKELKEMIKLHGIGNEDESVTDED